MIPQSQSLIGRIASGVAVAAAAALAACAAPPDSPADAVAAQVRTAATAATMPVSATAAQGYKVSIGNFTFNAPTLTVPVGATVTWTNADDVPHTVVSKDLKTFRSRALDTDDSFSFTFTSAGEYLYFCSIHPMMTGKIVVKSN